MKNLSSKNVKRTEKMHKAVSNLIDAAYDSGWLSGKIEALANKNIVLTDDCRDELQLLIMRRNSKKSDLIAMIDTTIRTLPQREETLLVGHRGNPCELCGLSAEETVVDECLGALLESVRDIKVEIAFPSAQLSNLEPRTKTAARLYSALTGEAGDLLALDGVKVRITYPKKPRVTWNTATLMAHSTIYPELLAAKTEKMAAPSVSIKVE